MEQELHDFLLQVEDAIIGIQQAADACLDDVNAVEGILVHVELLLKRLCYLRHRVYYL